MIKFEYTEVCGFSHAIRGMRNPKNSWDKSDSQFHKGGCLECPHHDKDCDVLEHCMVMGEEDLRLANLLANAGTDHGKFLRFLIVYVDINAPLYWWKEADTYRMGVEKNSCSTMHKIHDKEFCLDDFSAERLDGIEAKRALESTIHALNRAREGFNECARRLKDKTLTKDEKKQIRTEKKKFFDTMIQLLPTSYNQRRTCMISYAALRNMYHARKNHKLDEWHDFCAWCESLPYSELITGGASDV